MLCSILHISIRQSLISSVRFHIRFYYQRHYGTGSQWDRFFSVDDHSRLRSTHKKKYHRHSWEICLFHLKFLIGFRIKWVNFMRQVLLSVRVFSCFFFCLSVSPCLSLSRSLPHPTHHFNERGFEWWFIWLFDITEQAKMQRIYVYSLVIPTIVINNTVSIRLFVASRVIL